MIKTSKEHNPNYLAKVIQIKDIKKHGNADRLQIVTIDFQPVITGMDAKEGDIMIYFPPESKLNKDLLSYMNEFRDSELNVDKDKTGLFESNCRIKAIKLRGEQSFGFLLPYNVVFEWTGITVTPNWVEKQIGSEFDTVGTKLLVSKYVPKYSRTPGEPGSAKNKSKIKAISRLIDGQWQFHNSTNHLRKSIFKLNLNNIVSITNKTHGTSWWTGNVQVMKQLKWYERFLKWVGVNVVDTEYDIVYGSRKVVKNKNFNAKVSPGFYGTDLWGDVKNELDGKIPKGFTLYGELLGYAKTGKAIQGKDKMIYDYGCNVGESKIEVYRITQTNVDGHVTELSYPQIVEFCERHDLTASHLFYYGTIRDLCEQNGIDWRDRDWRTNLIKYLEDTYNDKNCSICLNKVPEEGIVLRKDNLFNCVSYKLKSPKFVLNETKNNDKGQVSIEDEN